MTPKRRMYDLTPPRRHAASVGPALGLGPVAGLFYREVRSARSHALGFLFVLLALTFCVAPGFAQAVPTAPRWLVLLVMAAAATGVVFVLREFRQPEPRAWVYLFEGGLAEVDQHGELRSSVRWDQVDEVDWKWEPHSEGSGSQLVGYRLHCTDGRTVVLPVTLRSADDSRLSDSLEASLVQPRARRTLDRLAAGQIVEFGPVRLDPAGLTYRRKPPLPWAEIAGWQIDDGQLELRRITGRPRHLVLPLDQIPGGWTLVRTLAERHPAGPGPAI